MSQGYVERILDPAKTLTVIQELPVLCGDLGKTGGATPYSKNLLSAKEKAYQDGDQQRVLNYERVARANRVSYFDLEVKDDPSKHLAMHLEETQVSSTIIRGVLFKNGKQLRPVFYLPYRRNGLTRMKLDQNGGDEVRFFATAAIDGCSVYIEGPPATPTVSHLNASNIAPPPNTAQEQLAETEVVRLQRVQQKYNDMDRRMRIVKGGNALVVERKDYIEDTAVGRTQMRQLFADQKHVPLGYVTDYQPQGAVVGVKSDGAWKFYLQKCGKFSYRTTAQGKELRAWMVIEARECWPAGGALRILN